VYESEVCEETLWRFAFWFELVDIGIGVVVLACCCIICGKLMKSTEAHHS